MDKPQPQWELVIDVCFSELHLYPETNDANTWIQQEASTFGALDSTLFNWNGTYVLRLFPSYDSTQVALYLAMMGNEKQTSSLIRKQYRRVFPPIESEE